MGKLIIEIPPITEKDCYYLQERTKPCFNYPLHKHEAFELNYVEHCKGAGASLATALKSCRNTTLLLWAAIWSMCGSSIIAKKGKFMR